MTTTTRAAAFVARDRTRIESITLPTPARGEVIVRVTASGMCGTDLFKFADPATKRGAVLGHEIAGVVDEAGEGAAFQRGDRVVVPHHVACGECLFCRRGNATMCATFKENVMFPGGFSERVLIRERGVRLAMKRIPDSIPDAAAVFMEPAACVLRGINRSGIASALRDARPAVAAILGGGSMGLLHLLTLKAIDAKIKVVVGDRRRDRADFAMKLGADAATDSSDATRDAVMRLSGGTGADAVFDTVGGAALLRESLDLLRDGGTAVLFAHARPGEASDFPLNPFFKGERRVVATYSGSLEEQNEVWKLITSGRLDASPLVTHRLPLTAFQEGLELSRKQEALKVLFVPGGEESAGG